MRTYHIAFGLIENIGSLVPGLEDLTGKWTSMGFAFVGSVVFDNDCSAAHDDSSSNSDLWIDGKTGMYRTRRILDIRDQVSDSIVDNPASRGYGEVFSYQVTLGIVKQVDSVALILVNLA